MKKLIEFPYKNILVLGLAKSGTATAKLLLKYNLKVRVNDMKATETDTAVCELRANGAEVIVGGHPIDVLDDIDLIVKNPGIPYDNDLLVEAQKRAIPIITEIELAGKLAKCPIVGVTGSNGKTTTTTLVAKMLEMSNLPVQLAGNIGTVAVEVAETIQADETLVLELSSFQLLGIQTFKPKIAVLLNLFEAHLDYHKTVANYIEAKCNIFKNQTATDYLVYNADDQKIVEVIKGTIAQRIPFSIQSKDILGAYVADSKIYFQGEEIIALNDIVLVGSHNLENILAAICAAKLSGATNAGICAVLTTFEGVKHRLQFVANINKRLFYNDSKATNILATQKALQSFTKPTILLAGGLDRGNGFSELIPYLDHVKAMVVFGETAAKLTEIAHTENIEVIGCETMAEAVKEAYRLSAEADVILLSPACASWDQYPTFEKRGDMFIDAVHTLV